MSFAERYGFRPVRAAVQVDALDDETRTALWNVTHVYFVGPLVDFTRDTPAHDQWATLMWLRFFKGRLDQEPA